MTPIEFNIYLMSFENILIFPAYMKYINEETYNVDFNIIKDFLFMYGKNRNKPCICGENIHNYKTEFYDVKRIIDIPKLIQNHEFKEGIDYNIENEIYLLSPKAYYKIIYSSKIFDIINQFNKVFTYEHMYTIYLEMKNQ